MILMSIHKKAFSGHKLRITKAGGFWPVLLTDIYMAYEIDSDDVFEGINNVLRNEEHDTVKGRSSRYSTHLVSKIVIGITNGDSELSVNQVRGVEEKYLDSLKKLEKKGFLKDSYEADDAITITGGRQLIM